MKFNKIILVFLILTLSSCEQSIESQNVQLKNGLYINAESGELLDGKYKSVTPIGGTYSGDHVSTFEYDEGIPVGKWSYTFNGDPIQSGEFLDEPSIKADLESITKSKRVDFDLWNEGGSPMLTIYLIEPQKTDAASLKELEGIAKDKLLTKYEFKVIYVEAQTDQETTTLIIISLE